MQRREFLKMGGSAAVALAFGGCASRVAPQLAPTAVARRRVVNLVRVECSMDRIIRSTVGLRPSRKSGFRLAAERLDDKTVIHNYGHGGSGMTLSWGTGYLAADLATAHADRRAAVLGCGMVGLTAARQLQRRGFEVTVYAKAVPPNTTSNMSLAQFEGAPLRDPAEQTRRAAEIALAEHQLHVGCRYGVRWLHAYLPSDDVPPDPPVRPQYPSPRLATDSVVFGPGEHPFPSKYVVQQTRLTMEPGIYLDALMRDVIAFGGRIVVRSFDTTRDLMSLTERVIVNCTGLGAKALFGDDELNPVRGQSTLILPQLDVTYRIANMTPRSDGIVLGATEEPGIWTLDVDQTRQRRTIERMTPIFNAMLAPLPDVPITGLQSGIRCAL